LPGVATANDDGIGVFDGFHRVNETVDTGNVVTNLVEAGVDFSSYSSNEKVTAA